MFINHANSRNAMITVSVQNRINVKLLWSILLNKYCCLERILKCLKKIVFGQYTQDNILRVVFFSAGIHRHAVHGNAIDAKRNNRYSVAVLLTSPASGTKTSGL